MAAVGVAFVAADVSHLPHEVNRRVELTRSNECPMSTVLVRVAMIQGGMHEHGLYGIAVAGTLAVGVQMVLTARRRSRGFSTRAGVLPRMRRLCSATSLETETSARQRGEVDLWNSEIGVQSPDLPLPSCITRGQAPQQYEMTAEQIAQFEADGVLLISGACKDWGDFLGDVTDKQVESPHLWSFEGRLYGRFYDYFQRNVWTTNDGYRDFYYYSALGHVMSQLGRTEEVRISTDVLMVNPRIGFGWHQDCQNGPIELPDALRFWVGMDACGDDGCGAPQFLLGSHKNKTVGPDEDSFLDIERDGLSNFAEKRTHFVVQPGDLIVWHPRTIHRILTRPGGMARSAFGGSIALDGATYRRKEGRAATSDYSGHNLQDGGRLGGPYFPRIYPNRVPEEETCRARGDVWREPRNPFQTLLSVLGKVAWGISQVIPRVK